MTDYQARCEDLRTQLERMKEERDGLKFDLGRVMELHEHNIQASLKLIEDKNRLQELLDSTTAQLEKTRQERDAWRDHFHETAVENIEQCAYLRSRIKATTAATMKPNDVHAVEKHIATQAWEIAHLKRSRHEWKRRLACTLREFKKVGDEGYDLSTWAASINRDGEGNTSEWREGLEERILRVQALTRHHPLFSSWEKVDRLMKRSTKEKP